MQRPFVASGGRRAGEGVDEAEVGRRALHRDVLDAGRLTAGDLGRLEDRLVELIEHPEGVAAVAEAAESARGAEAATHIQKWSLKIDVSSVSHCLNGLDRCAARMKPTSASSAAFGGPPISVATSPCVVAAASAGRPDERDDAEPNAVEPTVASDGGGAIGPDDDVGRSVETSEGIGVPQPATTASTIVLVGGQAGPKHSNRPPTISTMT